MDPASRSTGVAPDRVAEKAVLVTGISEAFANPPKGDRGNAGNMVHARAAREILANWRPTPARIWTDAEVERLRAEASHLVVVTANAVKVNQRVSGFEAGQAILAANMRALGLPVVVLGLGAQAQDDRVPDDLYISEGTRDFLDCLGEFALAIGVRGAFTAEVLSRLGITKTTVLGCQSCFMSRDPGFADTVTVPTGISPSQIAASTSFIGRETGLFGMMHRLGIDMIGQTEFYEFRLAHDLPVDHLADTIGVRQATTACRTLGLDHTAYVAYLRQHFRQFADLDSWRTGLERYRLALGTRFHGNMWALQCGVPALWVAHDSRTRELCRHLGLPWIAPDRITRDTDPAELLEQCDYSTFRSLYRQRYAELAAFLEMAGVAHRL